MSNVGRMRLATCTANNYNYKEFIMICTSNTKELIFALNL